MVRAGKVCSTTRCPTLVPRGQSRCDTCEAEAEQRRGTAAQRGYAGRGHATFRRKVLARDPICVRCQAAPSRHADHYPRSRRELVAAGLNPNDPAYGRGLCGSCHSSETARHQPGGWHGQHHGA